MMACGILYPHQGEQICVRCGYWVNGGDPGGPRLIKGGLPDGAL